MRKRGLRCKERRTEGCVEVVPEDGYISVVKSSPGCGARVVDYYVDTGELLGDGVDRPFDCSHVRDIALNETRVRVLVFDGIDDRLDGVNVYVENQYPCASRSERFGYRATDVRTAAARYHAVGVPVKFIVNCFPKAP